MFFLFFSPIYKSYKCSRTAKRLLTKIRICTRGRLCGCSHSVSSKIAASFEKSKDGEHIRLQIIGRGIWIRWGWWRKQWGEGAAAAVIFNRVTAAKVTWAQMHMEGAHQKCQPPKSCSSECLVSQQTDIYLHIIPRAESAKARKTFHKWLRWIEAYYQRRGWWKGNNSRVSWLPKIKNYQHIWLW